jgi:hypothetical protein
MASLGPDEGTGWEQSGCAWVEQTSPAFLPPEVFDSLVSITARNACSFDVIAMCQLSDHVYITIPATAGTVPAVADTALSSV